MFTKLLSYAVYLAIVVFFVIGLVTIIRRAKNMTKTEVKTQIKTSGFLKVTALIFAVILTFIFCIGAYINTSKTSSAIITLNYAEASQGQNANQTRYNMAEIVCDEVLERTIEKGGFEGVSVKDLKNCFTVAPLIEGNSYNEDSYHISTEFCVYYTASKKTQNYPSYSVLSLLCNAYRDYYFDKYVADFELDNKLEENVDDLDYYDMVTCLSTEANQILNYLYGLQKKNSSFVSSTGATFASVSAKVYNLQSSQIGDSLNSFILQNGISKNPSAYIERLSYDNKQYSFERQKYQARYDVTNSAVVKYAEEMATAVLVPTRDGGGEYYMGRTKIGVDELSIQSASFSDKVAEYAQKIESNKLKITYLQAATGNTAANKKKAEELIEQIQTSIVKLAEEARAIGQEYYANQMNQCITASVSAGSIFYEWKKIGLVFVGAYIAFWTFKTGRVLKVSSEEVE